MFAWLARFVATIFFAMLIGVAIGGGVGMVGRWITFRERFVKLHQNEQGNEAIGGVMRLALGAIVTVALIAVGKVMLQWLYDWWKSDIDGRDIDPTGGGGGSSGSNGSNSGTWPPPHHNHD